MTAVQERGLIGVESKEGSLDERIGRYHTNQDLERFNQLPERALLLISQFHEELLNLKGHCASLDYITVLNLNIKVNAELKNKWDMFKKDDVPSNLRGLIKSIELDAPVINGLNGKGEQFLEISYNYCFKKLD